MILNLFINNVKSLLSGKINAVKCIRKNHLLDRYHKSKMEELQTKGKIKCAFFVVFHSVWKCDGIYKKMLSDSRFEPIIVICPVVNFGKENMIFRIKECERFFSDKGYPFVTTYNETTGSYLDVKRDINPDIVIYTNPYRGLIDDRYFIDQFKNALTVYIPYHFGESKATVQGYGLELHNDVWRIYAQSEFHKDIAKKFTLRKGKNVFASGYPGIESLVNVNYDAEYAWPFKDRKYKRIIWAPHHTISAAGHVNYSCFLQYAEFMISMAVKYKNEAQFVFKPHPILKNRLVELWGEQKTEAYYNRWDSMSNTCINDGEYIDLFLTSDAMIHDSGSFIAEYLCVNKPVMRTMNQIPPTEMFNEFGLKCLDNHYKAYNEADIESFIKNVISGVDTLKEQRTQFINDVLIPKNGLPSDNIINDIIDSIKNKRV